MENKRLFSHQRVPSTTTTGSGGSGEDELSTTTHPSSIPPNNSQQQLISGSVANGGGSLSLKKNGGGVGSAGLRKNRLGGGGFSSSAGGTSDSVYSDVKVTKRQWITMFILCFVNLINYMDRFTIAGILSKIKCGFDIGNSEAGLLQTVFVISYMAFAPLFGYLGDRYSRKWIMAGGVFLWSLTTLLGSFMTDFGWFMAFRAMVGIGEASYSTIAPTIISDMFVDSLRSKMLALFYIVTPVGCGLGYIVGSGMASVGGSWHWGLRLTPALGLAAVLLLVFVMKDPPRGESEGSHLKATSYSADILYLCKNRSFLLTTFAFTCVAFVTGALAWWGPSFIALGLASQPGAGGTANEESVAFAFGVITMLAGLFGVVIGSFLSTRLKTWNPRADPLICAFGLLASTPLLFLATIVSQHSTFGCYTLIFFGQLFLNLNWAIVADMLLYVVIPTRRSTAEAFQILLSHTFGDAGSPYLIGIVSDQLRRMLTAQAEMYDAPQHSSILSSTSHSLSLSGPNTLAPSSCDTPLVTADAIQFRSLQYSLFITCFVEILGGLFFLMTAWYIISDKMKADKTISGDNLMNEGSSPEILEADELSSSSTSTRSLS